MFIDCIEMIWAYILTRMKSEKQRLSEIKNLNKGVKKMKKIIILSIILVLGISLMAFAGAEKKVTLDRVDFVVG